MPAHILSRAAVSLGDLASAWPQRLKGALPSCFEAIFTREIIWILLAAMWHAFLGSSHQRVKCWTGGIYTKLTDYLPGKYVFRAEIACRTRYSPELKENVQKALL